MSEKFIDKTYLREHPDHIFVFGDNLYRRGRGGAAILRDEPNVYGFITKKAPTYLDSDFYKPEEYYNVFDDELKKLVAQITSNPDKTYLISRIGGGLANKYGIFEAVIKVNIRVLEQYKNIKFLYTD